MRTSNKGSTPCSNGPAMGRVRRTLSLGTPPPMKTWPDDLLVEEQLRITKTTLAKQPAILYVQAQARAKNDCYGIAINHAAQREIYKFSEACDVTSHLYKMAKHGLDQEAMALIEKGTWLSSEKGDWEPVVMKKLCDMKIGVDALLDLEFEQAQSAFEEHCNQSSGGSAGTTRRWCSLTGGHGRWMAPERSSRRW